MQNQSATLVFLVAAVLAGTSSADDSNEDRLRELEAAKTKLAAQSHRLAYRFSPGEVFRLKVVHLVTVDTKIRGVSETAQTRSVSTKAWNVTDVDQEGNVTFRYTVESVNMWQKLTGRQEIRYDSTKDDDPPAEYKHVAESVGVPMATVTISPAGAVVKRTNARSQFNPGIGELTIPLPEKSVKVGEQWSTTGELPLRAPDGRIKRVKTRQVYQLESVKTGVATISMQTQVLTPVNDPVLQSQLVQRVKSGTVKFDVDAGRVLSQQMDVDETVIGFSGADSIMKYLSRLTEEAVESDSIAGA
jgi:hypothetical protein